MKRRIVKIIAVCLGAIIALTFTGCKGGEKDANIGVDGRMQFVRGTDEYIVKDGKSDYKILITPDASPAEEYAAEELQYFLFQASGVKLEIVNSIEPTELQTENTKFISVGETVLADKAGIELSKDRLKRGGFRIDSYKDAIIINSPTKSGLIYGVYRFLEQTCNYKYYATDCYKIDRGDVVLKQFDFEDWPDFECRDQMMGPATVTDGVNSTRLFLTGSDISGDKDEKFGDPQPWSALNDTSFCSQLLDIKVYSEKYPDWFTPGNPSNPQQWPQICFSTALADRDKYEKGDWSEENYNDGRHGMFWTLVYNLINNFIALEPEKSIFLLGISDSDNACQCEQCTIEKNLYYYSGMQNRLANAIAEEVDKWKQENCPEREINLCLFAYKFCEIPPVDRNFNPLHQSVVLRDDIMVRYAPLNANYMYPLCDEDHNADTAFAIKGWQNVASKFSTWDYVADFSCGMRSLNVWQVMEKNIKTYYDMGVVDAFSQGYGIPFGEMITYVYSSLLWNRFADSEKLIDDFLENYYGVAGDAVKEYMTFLSMLNFGYHEVEGGFNFGYAFASVQGEDAWPRGFVVNAKKIFEKGYEDIKVYNNDGDDVYDVYKSRLDYISIFYRYLELEYYADYYSKDQLSVMLDEMEVICEYLEWPYFILNVGNKYSTIENWRQEYLQE